MFVQIPFFLLSLSLSPALSAKTIEYKKAWTSNGDKLPDFSYAGYHQSEIALPSLSTQAKKTLSPGSGSQSLAIQAALDEVFASGGGVVALKAGTYALSSDLLIKNGTILRGAGVGKTILTLKDASKSAITLGKSSRKEKIGESVKITDNYVPAGTDTVHVTDIKGLEVGMEVYVERGVTQKWVDAMGMRAHKKEDGFERDFTWLKIGDLVQQPRRIKSINGKAISLNIPLTDSLNAANGLMSPIQLTPYTPPAHSSEMGIENLSMRVNPTCSGRVLGDTTCSSPAISIPSWTTDSWVRNLDLTGFNNQIDIEKSASRITITTVTMNRDGDTDNDKGYALDIAMDGTQVLVHNCRTLGTKEARSYSIATQSLTPGPNACIGYEAQQPVESIEPHQRWAHGFLNEGSKVAAVVYRNRGGAGSGHGWTVNNAVSWNSNSSKVIIQDPPLGQNYCFGCVGPKSTKVGEETNSTGEYGSFVEPPSLFEAQLKDRGFNFKL
ncbi:hypothetical protein CC80DRAFT_269394 [Byssothecium circinans]|uniref:Uncharacterized protein n=1 Tax=Byssothecium circinans TaxID=147558 RepID=A0A6A5U8F5_9PLEO|nr:hypothetical protein CC80DRAFT_269394 [Byssothecium circinans]